MGLWASLLTALGILRRKVSILVLGLDNSGKTTLIVHLMRSAAISSASSTPPQRSIPTVGFSLETFIYDNLSVTVFDMSGQGRYRDLWKVRTDRKFEDGRLRLSDASFEIFFFILMVRP